MFKSTRLAKSLACTRDRLLHAKSLKSVKSTQTQVFICPRAVLLLTQGQSPRRRPFAHEHPASHARVHRMRKPVALMGPECVLVSSSHTRTVCDGMRTRLIIKKVTLSAEPGNLMCAMLTPNAITGCEQWQHQTLFDQQALHSSSGSSRL